MRTTNHKSGCPIRDQVQITTWPLLSHSSEIPIQHSFEYVKWVNMASVTAELMSDNRFGV